jgi:hypothetical protein
MFDGKRCCAAAHDSIAKERLLSTGVALGKAIRPAFPCFTDPITAH